MKERYILKISGTGIAPRTFSTQYARYAIIELGKMLVVAGIDDENAIISDQVIYEEKTAHLHTVLRQVTIELGDQIATVMNEITLYH